MHLLIEKQVPAISADALAHEVLMPGTDATLEILALVPGCTDPQNENAIDRRALGRIVFADANVRRQLEAIVHPPVIARLRTAVAEWRRQNVVCAALEIPLLFEVGLDAIVDRVVVVCCTVETQIARLQERLNIPEAEARCQLEAQWPMEEKAARADVVIDTNGTLEHTRLQVDTLWKEWCR